MVSLWCPAPLGGGLLGGNWVETDEIDDVSELFPLLLPRVLGAVEFDLFFCGSGGRTLPGNSVRNLLYKRAKSPYRRPT